MNLGRTEDIEKLLGIALMTQSRGLLVSALGGIVNEVVFRTLSNMIDAEGLRGRVTFALEDMATRAIRDEYPEMWRAGRLERRPSGGIARPEVSPDAFGDILAALRHTFPAVRLGGLLILNENDLVTRLRADVVEELLCLREDEWTIVRRETAIALAGVEDAEPALWSLTEDPDRQVRVNATNSLGTVGGRGASDPSHTREDSAVGRVDSFAYHRSTWTRSFKADRWRPR